MTRMLDRLEVAGFSFDPEPVAADPYAGMTRQQIEQSQWQEAAAALGHDETVVVGDGTLIVEVDEWVANEVARVHGQQLPDVSELTTAKGATPKFLAVAETSELDAELDPHDMVVIALGAGRLVTNVVIAGEKREVSGGRTLGGVVAAMSMREGKPLHHGPFPR